MSKVLYLHQTFTYYVSNAKCNYWLWKVLWFNCIFQVFSYIILTTHIVKNLNGFILKIRLSFQNDIVHNDIIDFSENNHLSNKKILVITAIIIIVSNNHNVCHIRNIKIGNGAIYFIVIAISIRSFLYTFHWQNTKMKQKNMYK